MAEITFTCGTPFGGALDSTASLAAAARSAGHRVRLVVADSDPYAARPRATAALVRLAQVNQRLGRLAWRVHDRTFAGTKPEEYGGFEMLRAADVPAAVAHSHGSGGVIVANSMRRLDLERLIRVAHTHQSVIVWYLREVASLVFAETLGREVDVVVANSRPLAHEAGRVTRRDCEYIPSVISRDGLAPPRCRRVILMVNPIGSHGLELALQLAALAPERQFVLQESWLLGDEGLQHLRQSASSHPNIEVRNKRPRSSVFEDARIMIAPHSSAVAALARPRVALESQFVGVPMVATDIPGLASVAASPALLIPEHSSPERWREALDLVDGDYDRYCDEAQQFAAAELPASDELWAQFATVCGIEAVSAEQSDSLTEKHHSRRR